MPLALLPNNTRSSLFCLKFSTVPHRSKANTQIPSPAFRDPPWPVSLSQQSCNPRSPHLAHHQGATSYFQSTLASASLCQDSDDTCEINTWMEQHWYFPYPCSWVIIALVWVSEGFETPLRTGLNTVSSIASPQIVFASNATPHTLWNPVWGLISYPPYFSGPNPSVLSPSLYSMPKRHPTIFWGSGLISN